LAGKPRRRGATALLMRLLTVVRGELTKMLRQKGTYAGYALLAVFCGLFVWGVWAEGPPTGDLSRRLGDDMAVGGDLVTGPLVPYILLVQIPVAINVFIPLLIGMVAGGLVAGEAQRGTLRAMLSRPVHRWVVMVGKLIAAFVHTATLVIFLGVFALVLGYIVFGGGDIVTIDGGLRIFAEPDALGRLALSYGLTVLLLCSVAAIAVLCSTVFEKPLTASGVTVGFLIVSATLMVIPYFEWLKPYLLTSHFTPFKHIFVRSVDWGAVGKDLTYIAAYVVAAAGAALAVFCRKDITC